jgi:demethylmenaquinone methyltransferase/2-methoxy-6-polyprenyl-1,4-benzoquinol methylase
MFGRVSRNYDLVNRLMTFGQDLKWRREAVGKLDLDRPLPVLDLGAGTGDMTFEILRQSPNTFVIGLDFTPEMLKIAKERDKDEAVCWVIADACNLPFPRNAFSGTISGFLMRNLPDLKPVLQEQHRVLRSKGKLVCLETSPVEDGLMSFLIYFHIHHVIPFLGRILSKDREAYGYLATSTKLFLDAKEFSKKLQSSGFIGVAFIHRMFGTVAIHSAHKS